MNRFFGPTLGALLALGSTACTTRTTHVRETIATQKQDGDVVIRSYEVPAKSAERYRAMLRNLLISPAKDQLFARVALAPDGRLVVVGRESVQRGVKELLDGMLKQPDAPPSVEVTYWVVAARPSTAPSLDASLGEIGDSLRALSKQQGGLSFHAIDRIAVRSLADSSAKHDGRRTEIEQNVQQVNGQLVADVRIHSNAARAGRFDTRVPLVPEQPVVVGEMGVDPDVWPGAEGATGDTRLFYIVRAALGS
jgi:hypothetical protein